MHETTPLSLSMISHELKNPLTLMRSTLQIIESRYSEVSKDPLWAQIFSDMDYMSKLLTELSVLGSGTVSKMTQINLYQIISEIKEMFAPEICRQKKEFVLKCEKEMCMYGDALKIRQMLVNLIQNAVEATVAGDVIEVLAEACEEWMRFRVCDTGCGIKTEQMVMIVSSFVF